VTAICVEGRADLTNITAVRWDAGDRGPEESSVSESIRWLDHGDARAFVRRADGGRGPRVRVDHNGAQRYLRSRRDDVVSFEDGQPDALLMLPRWQTGKTRRKHMSHH
jgi:hypothetical protein